MANLHYRLTLWNQIMYECKRVLTGDMRGRVIREKCEWTQLSVLPDRLSYVLVFYGKIMRILKNTNEAYSSLFIKKGSW